MEQRYRAIINMQIESHPVNEKNQCEARTILTEEYLSYGIKPKQIVILEADSKANLLLKLSQKIKELYD